jgi:predicted metal-dependent phosphoesterase TrpH
VSDTGGHADLHIHTAASDGIAGVAEILEYVATRTDLDVVAITDHERIDAALAARSMARTRGLRFDVIVGEEVTTRSGHLLGLFLEEPIRPLMSLHASIAAIHAQGGLAIPAHPLVPYPLCIGRRALLRLLADPDPALHPDAIEVFNPTSTGRPWQPRVAEFAAAHGLAGVGSSDAHRPEHIGRGATRYPGRGAEALRAAIVARTTTWEGGFHAPLTQVGTLGHQVRKYARDVRAEVGGRIRRDGTGRDLGYPGGRSRPPRFVEGETER